MTILPLIISEPEHPRYAGGSGKEPHQVYAKLLYNTKHGHALFDPPSNEPCTVDDQYPLAAFQRSGLQIGDVGYLKNGGFVRIFNVLDSHQQANGLPPTPFGVFNIPPGWNQSHKGANLPRGETFLSIGTSKTTKDLGITIPLEPSGGIVNLGGYVEFSSSEDSSATLALPTGADWDELLNAGLMKSFIIKHGLSWIHHINGELGCEAANGSVLLVTAFVSSGTYTSAVTSTRGQQRDIRFALTLGPLTQGLGRSISWSHADGLRTHMRPNDGIIDEHRLTTKHYPFVRGYLLSVVKNWKSWFRTKLSVRDGSKQNAPFSNPKPKSTSSSSSGNEGTCTSSPSGNGSVSVSQCGPGELHNISYEECHPLALVNDILFDLVHMSLVEDPASYEDSYYSGQPQNLLAISHDDNLTELLKEGEGIPDRETLKRRMMEQCKWRFDKETGVISLALPHEKASKIENPTFKTPLTQSSNPSPHSSAQLKHASMGHPSALESIPEKENVDPNDIQVRNETKGKKRLPSLDTTSRFGPPFVATLATTQRPLVACAF